MDNVHSAFRNLLRNPLPMTEEEFFEISKRIPDKVALERYRASVGLNINDLCSNIADICYDAIYKKINGISDCNTIIMFMPTFTFGTRVISCDSTHTATYRDFNTDSIFYAIERDSSEGKFELIHTFESGKNAIDGREKYPLGRIYKALPSFQNDIVSVCGEMYKDQVTDIYVVTSAYKEESLWSRFKSFHLFIKSIEKIVGKKLPFSLRDVVDKARRAEALDYVRTLSSRQKERRSVINEELNDLKAEMNAKFRELIPIDLFLNNQEGMLEKINKELKICEEINGVKSAYIDRSGTFHVFTDHIYIRQDANNPRNRFAWDIGKLHIQVPQDGSVLIHNATRQVSGYNGRIVGHPHVITAEGKVCLGEIQSVVYELLYTHEYSSLAGILINFARSVNLGDPAGNTVTRWPVIELNVS